MANAILGALKYIPASLARQALGKINPKFNNFFSTALSYGIDANKALDYLGERFESDQEREYKNQLDTSAANKTIRPDEMASRSQMQNAAIPGKALRSAAAFGLGAGLGGSGGQRQEEPQQANPEDMRNARKQEALQSNVKRAAQRRESELSPGNLREQFQQGYPEAGQRNAQGKEALLQTVRQLSDTLRNLQGG